MFTIGNASQSLLTKWTSDHHKHRPSLGPRALLLVAVGVQEGAVGPPRHVALLSPVVAVDEGVAGVQRDPMGLAFVVQGCEPVEDRGANEHQPQAGRIVPQGGLQTCLLGHDIE